MIDLLNSTTPADPGTPYEAPQTRGNLSAAITPDPAVDSYESSMKKWREDFTSQIDDAALNPDEFYKGSDLSFAKDPKQAQVLATNDAFLTLTNDGNEIPKDRLQRDLYRQQVAIQMFQGRGADSDESFHAEVVKEATKRKDLTEVFKTLGNAAQSAAATSLGEQTNPRKNWSAVREEIRNMPGYGKATDAQLYQAFYEMETESRAKIAPFSKELQEVFQSWENSDGAGKAVGVAKAVLSDLDPRKLVTGGESETEKAISEKSTRRTAYDVYSSIQPEQQDEFLQALGVMASKLPAEKRPEFFANIAKEGGRSLESLAQGTRTTGEMMGTVRWADIVGTSDQRYAESQKDEKVFYETRKRADFVQKVQNLREGTYDPVQKISKSWLGRLGETIAYGAPGVLATSAAATNPYTGAALFASLTESHYQSLLGATEKEMGYDAASRFATQAAPVAAALETASEYLGSSLLRGKLPFFDKALTRTMDNISNPIARGATRFVAGGVESGLQEIGQNYIDPGVRAASEAFGVETGTIVMPNAQENVEAFASVFPLALLGIPGAAGRDARVAEFNKSTDLQLEATGYSKDGIKSIRAGSAKGIDSGAAAIDAQERDPTTPEAIAAQKKLQATLEADRLSAQSAQLSGVFPTFVRTDAGWSVRDGETGEEFGQAATNEEALSIAGTYSDLVDLENEDQVAFLSTMLQAGESTAQTDGTGFEFSPGQKVTAAQEASTSEVDEARVFEQQKARDAMGGDSKMTDLVLGKSLTEFQGKVRNTLNKIFAGGTVLTVVHEETHGYFREALASGRITKQGATDTIRRIQSGFSDKSLHFLPENGEVTDTQLDEAVSEMAEALLLKNRKNDRATSEMVSKNLTSFAKIDANGKKMKSFMDSMRQFFKVVFGRANQFRKGIREGTIQQADIDSIIGQLYGTAEQDAQTASTVEQRGELLGESPKSLGPAAMADVLQQDAMSRIKDPEARTSLFKRMIEKLDALKFDKDELVNAFGKESTRKAIKEPRKISDIRQEYAYKREGVAAAMETQGRSKEDIAAEMQTLKNQEKEEIARQKKEHSPRARLLRAFAALDAIISVLPIEERGRVGGYTQLAKLGSDEKMLEFLQSRIEKLDSVFEGYLKKQNKKILDKILDQAKPKGGSGEKARGKLGSEAHNFFADVERAMAMSEEDLDTALKKLDEKIAATSDTDELIELSEQWQILQNYGQFDEKTAAQQTEGIERAQEVYKTGRNKWRTTEEARLNEVKKLAQSAIKDAGSGTVADVQEAKASDAKIGNSILSGKWSLKSFREILDLTFGADSKVAKHFGNAARKAFTARTRGILATQKDWGKAIEQATGKKGREARQQVYEMATKQTISVGVTPESSETVKVPIATFFDAENQASLGLSKEEIQQLTEQFEALPEKSRVKNLTLERPILGKTKVAKFTEAEAIHLSMLWGQDGYKDALRKHGFGEEFQSEIEKSLSDAAKSLRQWMADYYRDNFPELKNLYAKMYGVDLAQVDNYAPGTFYAMGTAETEINPSSGTVNGGGMRDAFLSKRAKHTAAPRAENAFDVFFSHVNQTEHWKAVAPLSRELHGVFGNPDVKIALTAKNTKGAQAINEWIKAIDQNGVQMRPPSPLMQHLITSQAYIALAWKGTTAAKNFLGATINAAYNMPLGAYVQGLGRMMSGKIEFGPIWESDAIQNRLHGGFSPEMRAAISKAMFAKPTLIGDLLMQGMEIHGKADAYGSAIGAAITYDYNYRLAIENGSPESEAKAIALDAAADTIARTSQPTEVIDRSLYELNLGSVGKLMFLFASEARQKSSMWATAWGNTLTGQPTAKDVRVLVLSHLVMSPLMFAVGAAIKDVMDDEDKDLGWTLEGIFDEKNWNPRNVLLAALTGPAGGVPFVRDLEGMMKGFGGNSPVSVYYNSAKALGDLFMDEPEGDEYDWYEKKILQVLQGMGASTGVAGGTYKQVAGILRNFLP